MSEKPDSAGLTASDEMPQEIQSLIAQCEANVTSFTNDQMYAALHFAEECWRKLVPGEQGEEASLRHDIDELKATIAHQKKQLSVNGKLVRRDGSTGVWMMRNLHFCSAARELACRAMNVLGMDSANDFRTRDKLINAIGDQLEAMLNDVVGIKAAPPQSTVIEGKGQAVRLPDPVWENAPDDDSVEWKYTNHSATLCCKYWISLRNFKCYQTFHDGSSWCISSAVTCKSLDEAKAVCWEHYLGELGVELEPRPAFVAPEKPELVLVRCSLKSGKQVFWATKNHAGDFVEVGSDNAWGKQYVEILNDKTGEVIA